METSVKLLLFGGAALGVFLLVKSEKAVPPQRLPAALPPPPPPATVTPVSTKPGITVPFGQNRPEVQAALNLINNTPEGQAAQNALKGVPGLASFL